MNTAQCRDYLVSNDEVQKIVAGRYGGDMEYEEYEKEEIAYIEKVIQNGKNPKKWKRLRKYKIDSKANESFVVWVGDSMLSKHPGKHVPDPRYAGGVVREFWLEDTDHITIVLIEIDGEIKHIEDFSD